MPESKYYTTSITINAPATKVWDAIIKPEFTRQYMFGCDAISDWKIGSNLSWIGHEDKVVYVQGKVVEFKENEVLAFTVIDPNGPYELIPENYLTGTWTLNETNGQTQLNISQGDFNAVAGGEVRFADADQGWVMVLNSLKDICEKI